MHEQVAEVEHKLAAVEEAKTDLALELAQQRKRQRRAEASARAAEAAAASQRARAEQEQLARVGAEGALEHERKERLALEKQVAKVL